MEHQWTLLTSLKLVVTDMRKLTTYKSNYKGMSHQPFNWDSIILVVYLLEEAQHQIKVLTITRTSMGISNATSHQMSTKEIPLPMQFWPQPVLNCSIWGAGDNVVSELVKRVSGSPAMTSPLLSESPYILCQNDVKDRSDDSNSLDVCRTSLLWGSFSLISW